MVPRLLFCLAVLPALSGCGIAYLTQAASGQLRVMAARQPIERLIARPDTPDGLRDKLILVRDIRDFAARALDLPDNASYRSYVDLHRPYVVWNVVAAPEFSVEPRRWCFPIAGCVAYRGYFREAAAQAFAARLRRRGDDVLVGGVTAYSTLGHMADPVLSSMLDYGDDELAATIFHELAHQLVYVPGDSEFNEAFAVTVEEAGLTRWLAARGRSEGLRLWRERQARRRMYVALFTQHRAQLRELYAARTGALAGAQAEQLRREKTRILDALASELRALESRLGLRSGYSAWMEQGLNNAHLASVATYFDRIPDFEALLSVVDGDLPRFYALVRARAGLPEHPRPRAATSGGSLARPPDLRSGLRPPRR